MANSTIAQSKLTNRKYICCLLFLGIAGLISYFYRAADVFPSASIDLILSKAQVQNLAVNWSKRLGYEAQPALKSTIFGFDESAKTFLEYELGLPQAKQLMGNEIPIWYWATRFCRPLNMEEFSTALSPSGQLISFEHSLENDRHLPSIPHQQARLLSNEFLQRQAGQNMSRFKPVEDGTVSQVHRTDHYFTWEDTTTSYKGARLRVYTYVSGNILTSYNYYLYVPQTWLRKFAEIRSYNKALEQIASIFYVVFNAATFFAFIWAYTSGLLRWRFCLAIAIFMGAVDLLESLNSMPSIMRSYATTMSLNGYLLDFYISAIISALGEFLQSFILVGAAEALYRLLNPGKIALEKLFSKNACRSSQVMQGLLTGHALFGIHIGWIIAYYLAGRSWGFWSPLEIQNADGLSDIFPFFSALHVGITAAVSEELTYRVLGMSILQRLLKNFWLANILQAAAWAFMHSNYPQEPAYARGVELTVIGFLYGAILKKFGVLPCLISHCVFDTFLGVMPLLSSPLPGLKLTAILAVIPFALLTAFFWWQQRKPAPAADDETQLFNQEIPAVKHHPLEDEHHHHHPYEYQPLNNRIRAGLAITAIAALFIEFAFSFPMVARQAQLHTSKEAAIKIATEYLQQHQLSAAGRTVVAWVERGLDYQSLQYIFEKAGRARAERLAMMPGKPLIWKVRFFRPLDPEEYLVVLNANGSPVSLGLSQSEDAPGTSLTKEQAQLKTESYLYQEHPELLPIKLDDVSVKQRKARTDYGFRYNADQFNVQEAKFKIDTDTIGNTVCNFDHLWQLPDKWVFEQSRQRLRSQVCGYLVMAVALVGLLALVLWTIGIARSGAIRWRPAIILAGIMAMLSIPQILNDLPELNIDYNTDTPQLSYLTLQFVKQVLASITNATTILALSAFSLAAFRIISPRTSPWSIFQCVLEDDDKYSQKRQRDFWLDATLAAYAFGIGYRALTVSFAALHTYISPTVSIAPLDSFCTLINVASPSLDTILDAISKAMQLLLSVSILVGLYAKYIGSFRHYLLLSTLLSLVLPSADKYWQNYLIDAASYFCSFMFTWLFVRRIGRKNLLAYFLVGAISVITGNLRLLQLHAGSLFNQDILVLLAVLAAPAVFTAMLYLRRTTSPESSSD